MNKLKVAVIFGGPSVEHDISIISGIQVIENLDKEKYEIMPVYWTREGKFLTSPGLVEGRKILKKMYDDKAEGILNPSAKSIITKGNGLLAKTTEFYPDVILPIMHGSGGEDGALQGFLEVMNVPYMGCNVGASFLAMDKNAFKEVMKANGVNILPWQLVRKGDFLKPSFQREFKLDLKFPVICKPNSLGSSIGVQVAMNENELMDALGIIFELDVKALIEPYIKEMMELNCSVLGNADLNEASVCERPLKDGEVLGFEDKYMKNGKGKGGGKVAGMAALDRVIPADVKKEISDEVQRVSKEVFTIIGGAGVVRVDTIVPHKSKEVLVNEVNPIPGSLAFYLWEASGLSFPKLLDRLVEIAQEEFKKKTGLKRTFESPVLDKFLED